MCWPIEDHVTFKTQNWNIHTHYLLVQAHEALTLAAEGNKGLFGPLWDAWGPTGRAWGADIGGICLGGIWPIMLIGGILKRKASQPYFIFSFSPRQRSRHGVVRFKQKATNILQLILFRTSNCKIDYWMYFNCLCSNNYKVNHFRLDWGFSYIIYRMNAKANNQILSLRIRHYL